MFTAIPKIGPSRESGEKIFRRFPDAVSREDALISIEGIVDAFAFLYRQPQKGVVLRGRRADLERKMVTALIGAL